jgi:hypothetical protein
MLKHKYIDWEKYNFGKLETDKIIYFFNMIQDYIMKK